MKLPLLVALFALSFAAAPPEERKLFPFVDEAAQDASFLKFREELQATLKKKDSKALLAVVDPAIEFSFGGDRGLARFKKEWKLDKDPGKSGIWAELERVLSLGGSWRGKEFEAPYVSSKWPDSPYDPFDYVAVVKEGAQVRKEPKASAPVIATLKLELLRLGPKDPGVWTQVTTHDGKTGWVKSTEVRSAVDYRAFFRKIGGKWRMTTLIAGD